MHSVFTSLSLRARIFATIGLVLLPLALTAVWAIDAHQRAVQEIDRLIAQSMHRLDATIDLQNRALENATVSAHPSTPTGARRVSLTGEIRSSDVLPGRSPLAPAHAARLLGTLADVYRHEGNRLRQQLALSQQRLLWMVLVAVIGCLLIAAAGAAMLSRSLLKPLQALKLGVARFAGNDFSLRLPDRDGGELGQLAREINRMASQFEAHQSELQDLSSHDPLTGLFNRREFSQRLLAERERGRRYGPSFSLLMVDVDHFKKINDRFGHPAGDEVLTTVADLLRLRVRPMDIVCRHGGEEFAILLPETETAGALSLAERIRSAVADSTIQISDKQSVQVTVSIGLASFKGHVAEGIDPLAIADQALYRAKESGRNRVVSASDR